MANDKASASIYLSLSLLDNYKSLSGELKRHIEDMQKEIDKNTLKLPTVDSKETKKSIEKTLQDINNQISKGSFKKLNIDGILSQMIDEVYNPNNSAVVRQTKANETLAGFQALKKLMGSKAQPIQNLNLQERLSKLSSVALERIFNYIRQMDSANNLKMDSTTASTIDMFIKQESDNIYERIIGNALSKSLGQNTHGSKGKVINNVKYSKRLSDTFDDLSAKIAESRMGIQNYDKERHSMDITKGRGDAESIYDYVALYTQRQTIVEEWNRKEQEYANSLQEHKSLIENRQKILKTIQELDAEDENYTTNKNNLLQTVEGMNTDIANIEKRISLQEQMRKAYKSFGLDKISMGSTEEALLFQALNPEKLKGKFNALGINKGDLENIQQAAIDYVHSLFAQIPKYIPEITKAEFENQINEYNRQINAPNGKELNREEELALNRERTLKANLDKMQNYANSLSSYTDKIQNAENVLQRQFAVAQAGGTSLDNRALKGLVGGGKVPEDSLEAYYQTLIKNREQLLKDIENINNKAQEIELENPFGEGENAFNTDNLIALYDAQIKIIEEKRDNYLKLNNELIEAQAKAKQQETTDAKTFNFNQEDLSQLLAKIDEVVQAFSAIQGTFNITEESFSPIIHSLETILDLMLKISSAEQNTVDFSYTTGIKEGAEEQTTQIITLKGLIESLNGLKIDTSSFDTLAEKLKDIKLNSEQISITPETFQPLIDGINKVISTFDVFIEKYESFNNILHATIKEGLFGESLFKDTEEMPKLDLLSSTISGNIGFYSNQIEDEIIRFKNIMKSLPNSTIDMNALELLLKKIGEISSSLERINTEWKDAFNSSDLINTFNKISNGLDTIINKLTTLQESGGIKQVVSQIDFASLQDNEDFKKVVQGTSIPTSEKIRNQIKDLLIEQAKEYMQSYIFDPKELALDPKKLGNFIRKIRGEAINKYGKLYDTPALITKAMSGAGFHSKDPKTEFHIESSKELVNDRINLALGQFARSDKGINILVEQLKEYQEALDNIIVQRKELSKMIDSEATIKNMLPEDIKSKAEEISQALHNMYSEGKQGTKEYLAAQIELERLLKQSVINFGDGSSKKGMELLGAENIKDAETKLVEFWKNQGSAFDDFSMKFTDYYTNLYDTANPNKLSNMQDMIVKGLGFMGSSGTSGFNLFEDITQKTEELKFVIDYINENYQQINEAAERLVQFGKLNTEQAQQQAQAEEQVADATERAAEAQTGMAREKPDGGVSNPNINPNPQIRVEFDNDSVINVVEELGTLTDYINNQFNNLPPIRVNLNPDSITNINAQITTLIQTLNGNRDIPIEVHLNYNDLSIEQINGIINQINNQLNNVVLIQIEINPESLTNVENRIRDFTSTITNYTHIPLEISLSYNEASLEHVHLIAENIISELNQQFAQVEISPQITVDGSRIVINGNQPPVVPINTPAEPQIESPISPAVVNEVKDAEQQIRGEVQATNEAIEYEWELFNEPTGQLSFFENLAEESTEATKTVTENLNKIKNNITNIEGQITLDDFREEQKRAQYEHTMTYNANDRLRYIGNRVKATNGIDLSKYDGVNTNNLESIRNSQKLIDQYYRILQGKYDKNGQLLEPNKLQFALDLVKKIWAEIDNIRNLTGQIELPDSIENVLAQERAEQLAQQKIEQDKAIASLESHYAKETKNNSYGLKDILDAQKFDNNYAGVTTARLKDYRASIELLKEAKAEIEANFDANGKLIGSHEKATLAVQNYKEALAEVKRIQEEILIEGKNSDEANLLADKAYLEKTYGKQVEKGKLWSTDINNINNKYSALKNDFTEEQLSQYNAELKKINSLREQVTKGFDNKGNLIGNPVEIAKAVDQYHQAYDIILSIIRLVKQNKAETNSSTSSSKEGKSVIGLFDKSNNKLTDLDALFNKVGTGEKGGYIYTDDYAQALENAKNRAIELQAALESIDWTDDEQVKQATQDVKDFEDQIKDLTKLNKDMVAKSGAKLARNIAKYINDNPAITEESRQRLQEFYNIIMENGSLSAQQLREIGVAFTEIQASEEAAGNTGETFFTMLEGRAKSLVASLATFMSFYRIIGYIRQGFGVIKEFDDALAEMQKVSNETLDTLKEFQGVSFDLADSIGSDALALQQSVAEFMRLGQSLEEATDSAKSANILLNVSEFTNASEASEALIAMSQAYQDLSNIEIIDVINKLGNDFPISTQGLATALQDGAASLTTAGNSFYEAAALVTAGNRITQDPSKVGKAMRTIALRLTGTEASKAELEEDGEEIEGMITNVSKLRDVIMQATKVEKNGFKGFDILKDNGAYKSTYEILLGISEIYEDIVKNDEETGAKGANLLLETIAGKNRASIAASILQSPQMLKDAYAEAIDAEGSAEIENAKFINSISGHLEKLKNAWQEVWANALNRETINFFLDLGTAILKVVSNLGLIPSILLLGGGIATLYEFAKGTGLIVDGLKALNNALATNTIIEEANTVATKQETKANIENVGSQAAETTADAADTAQTMAQAAATEANVAAIKQETAENLKNAASQGVKEGSKKTSIGANLATNFNLLKETATNAFTAIGGIKGILGGGLVIGGIVAAIQAYDALNISASETTKEAKEISSAFEESLGTIQEHKDTINELSESYKNLSQGVNTSTNTNLTLSNDEYKEYLDTCNKIAEIYPQLITGYDLQGNAIINLTGNVKNLQKALIEEQKTAADTFLNGGEKKGISGFFDNIFGFFGLGNKNSIKDNFNKNYDEYQNIQEIQDYFLKRGNVTLSDYDTFRTNLLGRSLEGDIDATNLLNTLDGISNGLINSDEKLNIFLKDLSNMEMPKQMQESMQQAQQTLFSNLSKNDTYWDLIYNENEEISKNASNLFTNAINKLPLEKYSELFSQKDGMKNYANALADSINSALTGANSDEFLKVLDNIEKYTTGNGVLASANMGDFIKLTNSYKQAFIDAFADSEDIDGAQFFETIFDDKGVSELTDRFNQVLDNASFIQNDADRQKALDYFNSLGQEEARMYTESFKDATSFEDVDRKFGSFQRSLAAKTHEAIINIEDETAAINTLKSAISSSNGDTGLSSEEITNLETLFKDLMDEDGNPLYSAPELFENTANGIRLNQKQLKKLNNEYKREKIAEATDKLDYYQKALIETQNEIDRLRGIEEKEADLSAEERNRDSILQNIDALQREITQYEGLTSAYNEYVNALSTTNGNAGYDTIQSGYDTVKDLIDRGWGGADEVRQYVQMFTAEDVSTWSVEQLIERFNELDDAINSAGYSYKDFFTVDENGKTTSDGVFNFLDALKQEAKDSGDYSDAVINQLVSVEKKYSEATGKMEDFYSFDFDAIGGDQAVADLMNMDISTLHKWLEAAEAAGFDVVWTDYAHKVANATKTIKQAREALEEFKEVNAEDYKLNTSADSVEAVEVELSKAQELIQEIQNDDTISPEVSTAKLDYVQAQLDSLIQTKLILEQPLLFNTNLADVEGDYQNLFLALQNYGMELQTVQTYGRMGLPVDTSQADQKLKGVLKALQGLDKETQKEFGIDFNLEDEDALEQLKEKLANEEITIPIRQVMGDSFDYSKLPQGKDTIVKVRTVFDDNGAIQGLQLVDSLGNIIDGSYYTANVGAVDNATPVANTAQKNLEDVSGEYTSELTLDVNDKKINDANKAKAELQKGGTGNLNINSNIQSFYKSFVNIRNDFVKPRTTTWTIKQVSKASGTAVRPTTGSGGGGFIAPPLYKGTAHILGTAYARGTSGNWGVSEDQDALTGELGEELVVRNGHFFTVGSESAEMVHLQKGDIVFNADQTKQIFEKGRILNGSRRGRAHADGTAYSAGSGGRRRVNAVVANSKTSNNSSSNNNNKSNNKKSSNNNKEGEKMDWITIAIERIEQQIDELNDVVDSVYRSWSDRNQALAEEIKAVSDEIAIQQAGYKRYLKEAESVGLSAAYAKKVREGTIDIEKITDENLKKKIDEYQQWYKAAEDCRVKIAELEETENELYQKKIDNIIARYEAISNKYQDQISSINALMDLAEEQGLKSSSEYYKALQDWEQKNYKALNEERQKAFEQLQDNIAEGMIIRGSEAWLEAVSNIDQITESIINSQKALVEYNNEIRQIKWDNFDLGQERIKKVTDEVEFMIDTISNEDLFDEKGTYTAQGLASQALHMANLEAYTKQSEEYAEAIEEARDAIVQDPYNQELIDRYYELIEAQQDAISNIYSEKDAIKDLIQNGIDKELESLQKLIDKYKDAISSQSDLLSYQDNVTDQAEEIAKIQKQIAAYSGDNSEESRLKVQQLQQSLKDAQKALSDTQREHNESDITESLDSLYEQYEELINEKLKDTDALISEVTTQVNANGTNIRNAILESANKVDYTLTEALNNIVSIADGSTIASKIGETIAGILQNVINTNSNSDTNAKNKLNETPLGIEDYGWQSDSNGNMQYREFGANDVVKGGMHEINGRNYYFDEQGNMKTGFITNNGITRYFDENTRQMASGLTEIDGYNYYFDPKNNKMQTGNVTINGKDYYFSKKNGRQLYGIQEVDGSKYFYNSNAGGEKSTGLQTIDGKKYYFDPTTGQMVYGLQTVGKDKYYFDDTEGYAIKGFKDVDGQTYYFKNANGIALVSNWLDYKTGNKIYRYRFDSEGHAIKNKSAKIGKTTYYFNKDGRLLTKKNGSAKTFSKKSYNYATGAYKIGSDREAWTQEYGKTEAIIRPSDGAVLTPIVKNDSVLDPVATKNMFAFFNNPTDFFKQFTDGSNYESIPNNIVNNTIGDINVTFNIEGSNITDFQTFMTECKNSPQFEKMVRAMTVDRMFGGSALKKFKV